MMKEELEWLEWFKLGDLVIFRNHTLESTSLTGLITHCPKPSLSVPVSLRAEMALYRVLTSTGEEYFTADQLVLV